MSIFIRLLKYSLRLLTYCVLGVFAALIAGLVWIGVSPAAQTALVRKIASMASTPDQTLAIGDVSGLLSGHLKIATVDISDTGGVFASAKDLALEWHPLALVTWHFKADTLSVAALSVDRKPVTTQTSQTSSSTFSLPIPVAVQKIEAPSIMLGKALFQRQTHLSLSGSLNAEAEAISINAALTDLDTGTSSAIIDLAYAPQDNILRLNGHLQEDKDGIVATLLQLPDRGPLDIKIDGDGPLSDWNGTLLASVSQKQILNLKGHHALAQSGLHGIIVSGGGAVDKLLPPFLQQSFAGDTLLDVNVDYDPAGIFRINTGTLATGAFRLVANGSYDLTGTSNLSMALQETAAGFTLGLPLKEGDATVRITGANLSLAGPATGLKLDASARVATLDTPQMQASDIVLNLTGASLDAINRLGTVQTEITVGGSHFVNANLERGIKAPLTLRGPVQIAAANIKTDAIELESTAAGGTASIDYDRDSGAMTSDFKLFVVPAVLPDAVAERFDGTIGLSGKLDMATRDQIALSNLALKSSTLDATGSLSLEAGVLAAHISGSVPDIARLSQTTSGQADFTLEASGTLAAPAIKAGITMSSAVLAGRELTGLDVAFDGTLDPAAPKGNLNATGTIDAQPISIVADLQSADGAISLSSIDAKIGANLLQGSANLSADQTASGTFTFDFPQIELLAALAGQQADGDLAGSIVLSGTRDAPGLKLKATGSSLTLTSLTAKTTDVDMTISNLTTLAMSGNLKVGSLAQGSQVLSGLVLNFTRPDNQTTFDLSGTYDNAPLAMTGSLATDANATRLDITSLSAKPKGIALALQDPTSLSLAKGAVAFKNIVVKAGNGSIRLDGSAGANLNVSATLTALPASLANAFSPTLGAEGTMGGTVTVTGTTGSPVVAYKLLWNGAAVAQTRQAGITPLSVTADGRMANEKLDITTQISGGGGIKMTGSGSMALSGSKSLSFSASGSLPFDTLASRLASSGYTMTGTANFSATIAGTMTAPAITGQVTTQGARLVDVRRNLAINNLKATLSIRPDVVTITQMQGSLGDKGLINVSGTVGITAGSSFPADLSVKMTDATYTNGTLITANLGGDLSIKGPLLLNPVLSGTITLRNASITVPEKMPASLSSIRIEHKNASTAVNSQSAKLEKTTRSTSSGGGGMGLDLTLNAPSQLFVRGRGIDAELGGTLTLSGTAQNPRATGGFKMLRGRLSILGKRLDFSSGSVGFGGNLTPTLDFVATSTADTTTITVEVVGTASDPSVSFSSSPSLPEDEVLAQLIFGRSLTALSALQIAKLADAVAQLNGGGTGSLFDKLRSGLGVDDLDILTDDTGNTEIKAGKYINDKTYLEVQQGGADGAGKATINLDIGAGVKLQGGVGSNGSGNAGIFYEKEY
jgi:translocation and assembly module TamB